MKLNSYKQRTLGTERTQRTTYCTKNRGEDRLKVVAELSIFFFLNCEKRRIILERGRRKFYVFIITCMRINLRKIK